MDKEWFDQLTDAQKAKLPAMDGKYTIEKLTAFCEEEKLPLPDDFLDDINGGAKFADWDRDKNPK